MELKVPDDVRVLIFLFAHEAPMFDCSDIVVVLEEILASSLAILPGQCWRILGSDHSRAAEYAMPRTEDKISNRIVETQARTRAIISVLIPVNVMPNSIPTTISDTQFLQTILSVPCFSILSAGTELGVYNNDRVGKLSAWKNPRRWKYFEPTVASDFKTVMIGSNVRWPECTTQNEKSTEHPILLRKQRSKYSFLDIFISHCCTTCSAAA